MSISLEHLRRGLTPLAAGAALLAAAACAAPGTAQSDAANVESSAEVGAEIAAVLQNMVDEHELPGAAVIIRRDGQTLYENAFGGYDVDTRVPIASATKWVTAAIVMTAVERDGLDLDATVADYISGVPEAAGSATIRQLLSHTSGMAGSHVLEETTDQPMADAVASLLAMEPAAAPGEALIYGGASLQVAGYIAQERAHTPWQQLFHERIAGPLGWGDVVWDHPLSEPSVERPANPNLGAGLHLSATDYIAFMDMLAAGGVYDGARILSESSVDEILHDATAGASTANLPASADPSWGYGLGCWCEVMDDDGACLLTNSAGAFATFPWYDRESGVYGVIVTMIRLPHVFDDINEVRRLANELG